MSTLTLANSEKVGLDRCVLYKLWIKFWKKGKKKKKTGRPVDPSSFEVWEWEL